MKNQLVFDLCFLGFLLMIPTVLFSQAEIESPIEIQREQVIEQIGDYAQHAPAITALITMLAKKDKMGFWQFAQSYSTTLGATYILKLSA